MNYRLSSRPVNLSTGAHPLIVPAQVHNGSLLVKASLRKETPVGEGGRIIVNVKSDPNTVRYQLVHTATMDDRHHGKISYQFDCVIPVPANHTVDLHAEGFAECYTEWI